MVRIKEEVNLPFQNNYNTNMNIVKMENDVNVENIKMENDANVENIKIENDVKLEMDIKLENDVKVESQDECPTVDIFISNVVCTFSVRCHLNLREIAMNGSNVEYKRENGLLRMRLRKPNILATISSTGKITCTGATSDLEAKTAARRCARSLQKLGFKVRFENYRIVNVLGSCTLPWAVKIENLARDNRHKVTYEPELTPGAIFRIRDIKATVRIFSTGSLTVTAPSVTAVQKSIEETYPLAANYKRHRSPEEQNLVEKKKRRPIQDDDINDDFINDKHIVDEDSDNNCDSS